ncbi:DUF3293 domain-containing protein [Allopusillimonas ginsengisoli]|uniref:DUF3293 domain-containing protein n=1 Tax=Allopusillimonas ginsengisoli TaxID=453575 RepID=UPI001021CE64|nr:DUF3293 domain-containing protein [Allopusillimonas ginsengisoli]TEA80179.1 DUF3293 domain-containing protein [Allopusillimonas ginsengisoli]
MSAGPPSSVPDAIVHAFATARYVIDAPSGQITLSIGCESPALHDLMQVCGAQTMAILTAFNPGAQHRNAATNRAAQEALTDEARTLGLPMFTGYNAAAVNGPPQRGHEHARANASALIMDDTTEPTVILLGIHPSQASALASAYGQLAWVFAGRDAVPRLVWKI